MGAVKRSEKFKQRINELIREIHEPKKVIARKMQIEFRSLLNAYQYGILPRSATLVKMADYFQVPIDYLLGRTDEIKLIPAKTPNDFYTRYTYLRDLSHLTDNRVATDCNFRKSLCYAWKQKGHTPSLQHLDALCKYFDVSIDYLLGRTDDDTPFALDPDWH